MRLLIADSLCDYVTAIRMLIRFETSTTKTVLPVYSNWRNEAAAQELFPADLFEEELVINNLHNDALPDPATLFDEFPTRPIQQHLVVGFHNSTYAYTAVLHAYITNRDFLYVESLEDLITALQTRTLSSDATITICAEQNFFEQGALNRLFGALSQDFFPHRPILRHPIGFLTAPNLGALSFLLLKTYAYPSIYNNRKPLLITPFASKQTVLPSENHDTLCREDCSATAIQALLDPPRTAVAFYSHSHEDCIFLGTDILEAASSSRFGQRLSHLLDNGTKATTGISLPTTAIHCQVLLANMCTGIKFTHGLYPSEQNIGLGFVIGWPACYIAPTTIKNSVSPEASLFLHLMNIGCSIGESLQAVNATLANLSSDPQAYVLVGDPLVCVAPPEPFASATIIHSDEYTVTYQAHITTTTTAVIRVAHPSLSDWVKSGNCYLSAIETPAEEHKKLNVDYLFLPSNKPDELLLIMFSLSSFGPGTLHLTLTALAPMSKDEAITLNQSLLQSETLMALSHFSHKLVNTQIELKNLVKNATLFLRAKRNVVAYQKASQQKTKMLLLVNKLQKETLTVLLARLSHGTLAFTERYIDQFSYTSCHWTNKKCFCGELLYNQVLVHPIMSHVERYILLCPRCGIVSDSPNNGLTVTIDGPSSLSPGETIVLRLQIQNATEENLTCHIGMGIEYTKFMIGDYTINPSPVSIDIQAQKTESVPFEITCSTNFTDDVYFLKTLVLYNMHLICLHRPISIYAS
ncbi:hypothetical protein [Dictyobacter arantiisoli]|uniref:Uncharacterized protein n=1 Tax=Dictyobacter arantiisoli TaxID=2014874 RepID=A0A5A5TH67_9CHLR|nr:hypothetical protein [Dictyobacter arantiisoli]GCF10369.1 hypothetical protein KDI_39330 [Dictyobacter arantiisoli]